jgi:hypothetical protein
MTLLSRHFEENILRLFRHALTSYASSTGQFCEQFDSVAMGLILSPVTANFFMEDFEEMAPYRATHKPLCWFQYVGNTFVIWPRGPDRLRDFLDHLSSVHQNIQFTMETERDGHLPSLDINTYRRTDVSLGHKVYRNPTHTKLHLNSSSHHHPFNKHAILSTLVHWVRDLCGQDSLYVWLVLLGEIFRQSGYTAWQIGRVAQHDEKPDSVALLPYVGLIFGLGLNEVLSRQLPGGTEENHENPQGSRCPDRSSSFRKQE